MELGSLSELQIFVSVLLILGAAFVALVCDFLKGNNEQLRERNIELRTREDERERLGLFQNPGQWIEALAAALRGPKPVEQAAAGGTQAGVAPAREAEGFTALRRSVESEPGAAVESADGPPLRRRMYDEMKARATQAPPAATKEELDQLAERAARIRARHEAQKAKDDRLRGETEGMVRAEAERETPSPQVAAAPALFNLEDVGVRGAVSVLSVPEPAPATPSPAPMLVASEPEVPAERPPVMTAEAMPAPPLVLPPPVPVAPPVTPAMPVVERATASMPALPARAAAESEVVVTPSIGSLWADDDAAEPFIAFRGPLTSQAAAEPLRQEEPPSAEPEVESITEIVAAPLNLSDEPVSEPGPSIWNAGPLASAQTPVAETASAQAPAWAPPSNVVNPWERRTAPPPPRDEAEPSLSEVARLKVLPIDGAAVERTPAPVLLDTAIQPFDESQESGAATIPPGLHDAAALQALIEAGGVVSGVAIAIGINDYQSLKEKLSANSGIDSLAALSRMIQSMMRPQDFACQFTEDEYILLYPGESGSSAQRRLFQVSEKLWDFQLRSLGHLSVMFSWGGLEVQNEKIAEAVAAARERMYQTRKTRKPSPAETPGRKRVANG